MLGPQVAQAITGRDDILDSLLQMAIIFDETHQLPPPEFERVQEQHWWAVFASFSNFYIVWTEHRPVLTLANKCSLCGLDHLTTQPVVLVLSPEEFTARTYERYTPARLDADSPTQTEPKLDSTGTLLTSVAATAKAANGNG